MLLSIVLIVLTMQFHCMAQGKTQCSFKKLRIATYIFVKCYDSRLNHSQGILTISHLKLSQNRWQLMLPWKQEWFTCTSIKLAHIHSIAVSTISMYSIPLAVQDHIKPKSVILQDVRILHT